MFVIPTKYNQNCNYIINLIESIRRFSSELILVVDSNSEDKSYFNSIFRYNNIDIADINNVNYIDGAIWYGYDNYPKEDFFYIMHDSMQVLQNLEKYKNFDFTSFSYFDLCYDSHQQFLYCKNKIESLGFNYNSEFYGLFGISFFCCREILTQLKNLKLNTILPKNKLEMMGSERIWGFLLKTINIDITKNSIIGKYENHNITSQNPIIKKYFLHRL